MTSSDWMQLGLAALTFAVAYGSLRQRVGDLEKRHNALAKETRERYGNRRDRDRDECACRRDP